MKEFFDELKQRLTDLFNTLNVDDIVIEREHDGWLRCHAILDDVNYEFGINEKLSLFCLYRMSYNNKSISMDINPDKEYKKKLIADIVVAHKDRMKSDIENQIKELQSQLDKISA